MTCKEKNYVYRVIDAQEFSSSNSFYNEELEGSNFTVPTPVSGALQVVSTTFDNACHISDK